MRSAAFPSQSGGTEADNLAIRGITSNYQGKGNHIITSQFEHPAVRNTCAALEKEGWRVTYLPIYRNGLVRIEDVKAAAIPSVMPFQ